ncbi:MAG: hypothetical protein ACI841_001271 [Planctomycetota bacterium]|jgi:hypothetical protein
MNGQRSVINGTRGTSSPQGLYACNESVASPPSQRCFEWDGETMITR